jgi:hypothetical protein
MTFIGDWIRALMGRGGNPQAFQEPPQTPTDQAQVPQTQPDMQPQQPEQMPDTSGVQTVQDQTIQQNPTQVTTEPVQPAPNQASQFQSPPTTNVSQPQAGDSQTGEPVNPTTPPETNPQV